jgi:hypothetical protein
MGRKMIYCDHFRLSHAHTAHFRTSRVFREDKFSTFSVDPLWHRTAVFHNVFSTSSVVVFLTTAVLSYIMGFLLFVLLFCCFWLGWLVLQLFRGGTWSKFFTILFFVEVRLCSWRRQMVVFSSVLWPLMVGAFWRGMNVISAWAVLTCERWGSFLASKAENLYR